jgi:hypothetical protein
VAEASTTPSVLALGKELMQRVFDPKADPNQGRSALGAPPAAEDPAASGAPLTAPDKILDPPPAETQAQPPGASQAPAATPARSAAADTGAPPAKSIAADTAGARPAETKAAAAPARAGIGDKASARFALAGTAATAAAKTKALPDTALPPAASQKCRVWTASYGGQKSIIIRSIVDQVVNFTVLDVNSGQETREAEAFIAAYAKNGKIAGEYPNQAQALDKAFELCPEG